MQSLLIALCMLCLAALPLKPLQAAVVDDGQGRLNDLLNERLHYIENQGGPHTDAADVLRQTRLLFMPMPCPHCEPPKPGTDEEEAGISNAIRAEAGQGNPLAQFQLAVRYLEGMGMGRDLARGLRWLQTASDNGVFDATFALAQIYDRGIDVPVDHQRAAHFYQIATNDPAHSIAARQRLGEMLEFGIGIPKDYGKAMALYQGVVSIRRSQWTEFAIGRMYAQGKGVSQDYAKAAEWFLTAADGGAGYGGLVPDAECALAILYWTGLGIPRDQERSIFFLNRPNAMSMLACHKLNADIVKQRVRG